MTRLGLVLIASLLLLIPGASAAQDLPARAAPVVEEREALTLQVLSLEQQVIAERVARAEAEIRERQASIELSRRDFAAKSRELTQTLEAAAVKAGLDLKDGWRVDLGLRQWVK